MSLPQTAARRGFRTVRCLIASSIFLVALLPRSEAANPPILCNPSKLEFGNVQVGESRTLPVAISNRGTERITLSREATNGAGFLVDGIAFPQTLEPGQTFTFSVTFAPQLPGSTTGNMQVYGANGSTVSLPLMGVGMSAGQLTISPSTMNFGNVPVGGNAQQEGTLSASNGKVTIYSAHCNSIEFRSSGLSFPLTIDAGEKVHYSVTFRPQNNGKAEASLSFHSNAENLPDAQSLDGNGIPPETYTVSLSWQPSNSQGVTGYNVYRGKNSGGPFSILNSILDPNTSYIDNSVIAGNTYYYVTTAVNSNGQESNYSNQAKVTIP